MNNDSIEIEGKNTVLLLFPNEILYISFRRAFFLTVVSCNVIIDKYNIVSI